MTSYTIRAGDTLSKIARRFGVPLEALVILNDISDPNRIRAGQVLLIPEPSTDMMSAPLPQALPAPAPAIASEPAIDRASLVLPFKEYIAEPQAKDLIVLHFTAGRDARGAFQSWLSNPVRVATPYIVDPDGAIFELFDPSHWAYHLGVKGGTAIEKRSIGIEIANVGPLKPSPLVSGQLNWWPQNWGVPYCRLEETDRYVQASYRGIDYFAAFSAAQVKAVAQLVTYLRERFGIRKTLAPARRRMEFDAAYFAELRGVAAHHNFRKDKWDSGPALDLDALGI